MLRKNNNKDLFKFNNKVVERNYGMICIVFFICEYFFICWKDYS